MKAKKPPILQYVCLALLFALASAYLIRSMIYAFPTYFGVTAAQYPFTADYVKGQPSLQFVISSARQAGLQNNDILLAVNGRPLTGLAVYGEAIRASKPGDPLRIEFRRPAETSARSVSLQLQRASAPGFSLPAASILAIKLVVPTFCILIGFWVAAVRPRDPSAWCLLVIMLFFSVYYSAGVESWGPTVRDVAEAYRVGVSNLWPLAMLLFGVYFPEPLPEKDPAWWKWSKTIIITVLLISCAANVIASVGQFENFASVASLYSFLDRFGIIDFLLAFAAIGTFFSSISVKMGKAVTPDARRRLKLLYTGSSISMGPACVLFVGQNIKGGQLEQIFPEWFVLSALTMMLLFPITLAYVIVVHRAMDVRVVIREGLQYALAKAGVRVLQVGIGAIVLAVAIQLALDPQRSRPQRFIPIAFGIAIVVRMRSGADRIRQWIDRRFFRDAYGAEQILESLSEEVRTIIEKHPLLERVATRLSESLHVPRVAVLLEENGCYRPAFALGYPGGLDAGFLESSMTVRQLKREAVPERIFLDDEKSWVNGPGIPEEERRQLATLQPQVLLPLSVKEKLLGIISLGEKRAEAPYSGSDLRVLKSVAAQTALALSNAELTSAIAHEIAGREKLNREIEIAREVQERLFPQRLPGIASLDYFGLCRTALGVGGDYYDFLALPDGKLGVALGDVSGKGIAAALTMASLQASLRADAMRAGDDIASLIARVNNMVYDASTEDRYATLFYAQFDPTTRRLSYVNAGHCPPILLRISAGDAFTIERLDKAGGTVVGLIPECSYEQAGATLSPGDLLVIYTDGFSEAMNPQLEEWGEERLIEAIKACKGLSAKETITRIIQSADAYAAGAPQSDDMTLVILRVLK
ncbi:MAG TPA: SpoIIE family protein phosphatase [Candidatus Acidoferrum sp.]|nr:SpoIIE family protein phosphatase [Candidatus Acidoferrum sp.]